MSTYSYLRVSTRQQSDEGLSLDAQERQLRGYALMKGLEIERTFTERAVSGWKPLQQRPEGELLMGLLKQGDLVLCAKLDRLFRSAKDALDVADQLKKRGVAVHLLDLGGDISSNGISRVFFTIVAAFAEFERDRISERASDIKANEKSKGSFLGGTKPYGYDVVEGALVANQDEQQALAQARAMRVSGSSFRAISESLKRDGVSVSHVTLARLLKGDSLKPLSVA